MTPSPVEAVVFDFGGVFTTSPFAALMAVAEAQALDPLTMVGVMFGPYDQDTDHPWHQLERGEVSLDDATAQIVALAAAEGVEDFRPMDMLMALGGSGVRDEVVAFCRSVRSRGFRTGLLTNNAREFEEFWVPLLPLDELFDDVVDSSAVGLRKPDPRIYELSLERLGVAAEAAVFVDDAPGNVLGAQRVGMRAVLIGTEPDDVAVALAELESHLS
ncbi:MAG: HAD family hydrolase [Actinomycetes bacterium]